MLGYCFVSLLVASIFGQFNIELLEVSVSTLLIRNVTIKKKKKIKMSIALQPQ